MGGGKVAALEGGGHAARIAALRADKSCWQNLEPGRLPAVLSHCTAWSRLNGLEAAPSREIGRP